MRDFKIYITISCLLLIVYVVVQFNKPRPVSWQPTLSREDKIPFGTYVFYHRLNDVFPGARVSNTNQSIYSLFSKPMEAGNYIIVATTVKINKDDFKEMLKYIKAGNTVFINGFSLTGYFSDSLKLKTKIESSDDDTQLRFTNTQFKTDTLYNFDKNISRQYFSKFDTARATVIVKNSAGHATYLSYKFGKGNILICANPELFSNYSLLTRDGASYAERALSYLPLSKNIFWDQYQNHEIAVNASPMRVFLGNESLQWAYYLSLFTLLIYVLFEMKRRQRIIPIVEPLKNSTVDFVNVVGRVYFERRDNANIAYKKILYLMADLRERYMLKTNKLDNDFVESLTHKTGISADFASQLVNYINYINQQSKVTDRELIALNQMIENFYAKS